jgi:hypothetical protein
MHLRPLALVLIILSLPLSQTTAGQAPAIRVRSGELDRTPLTAGPLKITLAQFRASFLKIGGASVEVHVVNTAATFTSFSPQKLSFLGSDNNQVDVLAIQSGDQYWRAEDRRIAPGARTKEFYALNGKLRLPARLYYDEKLLAEIIE